MKRIGNLYEKIISMDNLKLADKKARQGKTHTEWVRQPDGSMKKETIYNYGIRLFDRNKEKNLLKLHDSLRLHTFKTSPYEVFTIYEPKEREIYRLPYYPDRIVHHAIMNVLEPIWVKTFTHNTFSCIKGRGIEGCAKYVDKIIKKYEGKPLYCLKIDIKKFYPSIKHDVLKRIIRKKIKDKDLLWLLDEIIDSTVPIRNVELGTDEAVKEAALNDHRGIPIGNYLSQYLANLNLCYMMHKANEEWKVDCTEYADDIVFFSDSKEFLHRLFHEKVKPYIEDELELKVKENWQIFPISENKQDKHGRALDYVGYKFYRQQKLIRKGIKQNFCRAVAKANKNKNITSREYKQSICSWLGWAKHSNSKHLLKTILKKEYYDTCVL